MAMLFPLFLILILAIVVGLLGTAGFWSNLITLVNLVFAGLVTMNYYEWLAGWLADMIGLPDFMDLVAFWLVFALAFTLLRAATDHVSEFKLRFPKPVETAGSYVMAIAVGWVLICITTASLHTAPLARTSFFGGFKPEQPCFYGVAPDRLWLAFTQRTSQGALAGDKKFDDDGSFLLRYAARREKFDRN